jgi:hypothetical protein
MRNITRHSSGQAAEFSVGCRNQRKDFMSHKQYFSRAVYAFVVALILFGLYLVFWRTKDENSASQGSQLAEQTQRAPQLAEETELQPRRSEKTERQPDSEPSEKEIIEPSPALATHEVPETEKTAHDTDLSKQPPKQPHFGAAAYRTVVPEGGALLTGGWTISGGSKVIALVTPQPRPDTAADAVELSCEFFAIADEQMTGFGWENMLETSDNGMHLGGASYSADQLTEFRNNYDSEINNVISAPRVITRYGQHASLEISGRTDGHMLSVVVEENAAEGGIEVAVTVVGYGGVEPDD